MAYQQIATPYLGDDLVVDGMGDWLGMCLAVAEVAGGTNRWYGYAWEAWENAAYKHADYDLPNGCWVPVYWYGYWNGFPYGHIAWAKRVDNYVYIATSPWSHKPYFDWFEGPLHDTLNKVTSWYGMSYFAGWTEDLAGKRFVQAGQQQLEPYQRQVDSVATFYRTAPNPSASFVDPNNPTLDANAIVDFKGWVTGESVDNNNLWYVGRYTGGYAWSGGFTAVSKTGLEDLNTSVVVPPVSDLAPTQRQVGDTSVFYRIGAGSSYTPVNPDDPVLDAGAVVDFKGYVHGQAVVDSITQVSNDIWFVGAYTDGYAWSGGFTNSSTDGLPKLEYKEPEPPKPLEGVYMIDVSNHQGDNIDFAKVKAAGYVGVIIGAGHVGTTYGGIQPYNISPIHDKWTKQARDAGLAVGHYWYCYEELDPTTEANAFMKADIQSGEPLFIDAEESDLTKEWVDIFSKTITDAIGAVPIYYDYSSNLKNKKWVEGKVWQADYTGVAGKYAKVRQLDVIMHQYSSSGAVDGVSGNVDLNLYFGTIEDWMTLGNWTTTPDYPDAPDEPFEPEQPDKPDDDIPNWFMKFIQALIDFLTGFFKKK